MGLFWKSKKEKDAEEKLRREFAAAFADRKKANRRERQERNQKEKQEVEKQEKALREGEMMCRVEMVVGKEGDGNLCAVKIRKGFEMVAALQLADIVLKLTQDANEEGASKKMTGIKRLGEKIQNVNLIAEHLSKMDEAQLKDALRLIENVKKGA